MVHVVHFFYNTKDFEKFGQFLKCSALFSYAIWLMQAWQLTAGGPELITEAALTPCWPLPPPSILPFHFSSPAQVVTHTFSPLTVAHCRPNRQSVWGASITAGHQLNQIPLCLPNTPALYSMFTGTHTWWLWEQIVLCLGTSCNLLKFDGPDIKLKVGIFIVFQYYTLYFDASNNKFGQSRVCHCATSHRLLATLQLFLMFFKA